MIDVSSKFNTLRYALAKGSLYTSPQTLERVRNNEVPKGNVLEVVRAAGIAAAKRTSEWIVFCHPIPLDWVDVKVDIQEDGLKVLAEVRSIWKTGVEMEALTAVTAALLNAYDMLKPLDENLKMGNIRLVKKRGGKSDFTDEFPQPLKAGVLVVSTSTFQGTREDKSGKVIQEFLQQQPVQVREYKVVPDEMETIVATLKDWVDRRGLDLIFTTGGTGLGPFDLTPEATLQVIEKEVPGIAEAIRRHGKDRTPYAMLSREVVGVRRQSLIVNLPGSSKGARESLEALFPGLLHAFPMLWGGGHDTASREKGKRASNPEQ